MNDLTKKLLAFIEDPNKSEGIFSDDLFCDINVPQWRFQLQGADKYIEWIKGHWGQGSKLVGQRAYPLDGGFALEFDHEYSNRENEPVYSRNLWLCQTDGGKISEITLYCPGEWDEDTRRRQAAEAPMIRP